MRIPHPRVRWRKIFPFCVRRNNEETMKVAEDGLSWEHIKGDNLGAVHPPTTQLGRNATISTPKGVNWTLIISLRRSQIPCNLLWKDQNPDESIGQIRLNHWHYANAAGHVASSFLRSFHIQITKLIGFDSRFGRPISGPPWTSNHLHITYESLPCVWFFCTFCAWEIDLKHRHHVTGKFGGKIQSATWQICRFTVAQIFWIHQMHIWQSLRYYSGLTLLSLIEAADILRELKSVHLLQLCSSPASIVPWGKGNPLHGESLV